MLFSSKFINVHCYEISYDKYRNLWPPGVRCEVPKQPTLNTDQLNFSLEGASCFPLLLFYFIFPFSNSSGVALAMIGLRSCGATLANFSSYYWKPECATLADIKPVGLHSWKAT
jgi:hypothetical protein